MNDKRKICFSDSLLTARWDELEQLTQQKSMKKSLRYNGIILKLLDITV